MYVGVAPRDPALSHLVDRSIKREAKKDAAESQRCRANIALSRLRHITEQPRKCKIAREMETLVIDAASKLDPRGPMRAEEEYNPIGNQRDDAKSEAEERDAGNRSHFLAERC